MGARWPLRLLKWTGIALAVFAVLVVALRILVATPPGRAFVAARIEAVEPSGQSITLSGLRGDLLGRARLERLTLADAQGVWLEARDVTLDWRPMALLQSTLSVRSLRAREVMLLREPVLEAGEAKPSDDGTMPLRRLRLADFAIERVMISDAVLPEAAALEVSARAEAGLRQGDVSVRAERLDGGGDRLVAQAAWAPGAPLQVSLDLAAPPGGPIAAVLGTGKAGKLVATIETRSEAGLWQVTGDARLAGRDVADLTARYGRSGALSASARIVLDAFGPLQPVAARLGEEASVSLTASAPEDRRRALTLSLQASRLAGEGAGELVMDETGLEAVEGARLGLTPRAGGPVLVEGLSWSALRMEGEARRGDEGWSGTGAMTLERPAFEARRAQVLRLQGTLAAREEGPAVDATLQLVGADWPGAAEAALLGAAPSLRLGARSRRGGVIAIDTARLSGAALGFDLAGRAAPGEGTADLSGTVTLAASEALPLGARLEVAATRTGEGALTLAADGPLSLPGDLPDEVIAITGAEVAAVLRAGIGAGGIIEVETLDLTGAAFRLDGEGQLADGALAASAELQTEAIAAGGLDLSPLRASLSAKGPVGAPNLALQAEGARADLPGGVSLGDIRFAATGRYAVAEAVAVTLSGTLAERPLSFAARMQPDAAGGVLAEEIALDWGEVSARGRIALPDGGLETARSAIRLDGMVREGGLSAAIAGDLGYEAGVVAADLSLRDVAIGDMRLDRIGLVASGPLEAVDGRVTLAGAIPIGGEARAFDLALPVRVDSLGARVEVSPDGHLAGIAMATETPLRLISEGAGRSLSGALRMGDGRLGLDGVVDGAARRVAIDLDGVSLAPFLALAGRPDMSGALSGELRHEVSPERVEGSFRFDLSGLGDAALGPQTAQISLTGTVGGDALAGNVTLASTAGLDGEGRFRLPLLRDNGLAGVAPSPGAPVSVSAMAAGPVGPVWRLVAPQTTRLDGALDLALELDAPLDDLRPVGRVRLGGGEFEDAGSGVYLTGIGLDATLSRGAVTLNRFDARGGRGGTVSGEGRMGLDGLGKLQITLDRLDALERDDVTAIVSGAIGVSRSEDELLVDGDVTVNEARIDVGAIRGGGYTTVDVAFPAENGEVVDAPGTDALPVALGLTVRADNRIFIAAPTLDSEWGLDARVAGPVGAPRIEGEARLVRGRADLVGRAFRLQDGSVRFVGPLDETMVSLTATRSQADFVGTVKVTGRASEPRIELSATPALPEDEILARLLFGRSVADLSGLEAAQMAGALASLASGNALDMVGPFRSAANLDRLDFGFSESGGATLATGKYLTDDLYLELEATRSGTPGVTLEWTPRNNIRVDADLGAVEGPEIAIEWTRDFERFGGGRGGVADADEETGDAPGGAE